MIDKYFVESYSVRVPRYKEDNRRKGVCVMRVSSINVAQPRNVNYNFKTRQSVPQKSMLHQESAVSFKGIKAGFWSIVGTGVGAAAGFVMSGGLLAPLILGSAGTYAGALFGKSRENDETDQYGR